MGYSIYKAQYMEGKGAFHMTGAFAKRLRRVSVAKRLARGIIYAETCLQAHCVVGS